jgi:hypothetical protein
MELGRREADGATLRQHLQRLYQSTGRVDERLMQVRIPPAAQALWDAFLQLCASRRAGGMGGMHPITWIDIAAWCGLQRVQLTPWELDTLIELDAAALAVAAAHRAQASPPKT